MELVCLSPGLKPIRTVVNKGQGVTRNHVKVHTTLQIDSRRTVRDGDACFRDDNNLVAVRTPQKISDSGCSNGSPNIPRSHTRSSVVGQVVHIVVGEPPADSQVSIRRQ